MGFVLLAQNTVSNKTYADSKISQTGQASDVYDTVTSFNDGQGRTIMNNITLSAVAASNYTLPDDSSHPTQLGSLSLGAPQTTQNYTLAQGWTVPGYLRDHGNTASNSFGLHYGSASLNLPGSLVFGGYDQTRVLGPVGSFDLGFNNSMVATLTDISFGVASGSSPFSNATLAAGLLQEAKSSTTGISTVINPLIPYLLFSSATCNAIASHLPVTLNAGLGLYTWNTADPAYTTILSSPTYLSFTFLNIGTTSLIINVPLQLLNLTLTTPLVQTPTQYFPCRPYVATNTGAGDGVYFLGRAFLQGAFAGINWEQGKFFLAQAPGPAVGASQIVPIEPTATTIASNDVSEFAASWPSPYWNPIAESNENSSNKNSGGGGGGGLSGGAIAGIVIGVVALLLALVLRCVWRRRRRAAATAAEPAGAPLHENGPGIEKLGDPRHEIGYQDPRELGYGEPHEAEGRQSQRYEMNG